MKYCLDCDWYASEVEGLDQYTQSRKAIEHFVETGHAIDTVTDEPARMEDHPQHLLEEAMT